MSSQTSFGESAEMYLKTICELTAADPVVPISILAERLGISTVSATEMVHRMREKGLLEHLPYKGVRLTPKGESRALHVIRRHRIWERFLTDDLGLAWEEVHDSACRLEHAADRGVTEALAVHLGQPTTCPHGNPIPSQDASKHHAPGVQLDRLAIGDCGEILRVQQESREVLSFLGARGIKLGSRVQVTAINTYDGLWTVEIGGKEEVLGKTIASRLIIGNHLD